MIWRCGKVIYPNSYIAHQFMVRAKDSCEACAKKGVKLNYYYCELCEGYHLTRMNKKAQRAFIKATKEAYELRKEWMKENPHLTLAQKIMIDEYKKQVADTQRKWDKILEEKA